MVLSIYWLVTIGKIGKQEEVQGIKWRLLHTISGCNLQQGLFLLHACALALQKLRMTCQASLKVELCRWWI